MRALEYQKWIIPGKINKDDENDHLKDEIFQQVETER